MQQPVNAQSFSPAMLLDKVNFIVGPNGSGKADLVKQIILDLGTALEDVYTCRFKNKRLIMQILAPAGHLICIMDGNEYQALKNATFFRETLLNAKKYNITFLVILQSFACAEPLLDEADNVIYTRFRMSQESLYSDDFMNYLIAMPCRSFLMSTKHIKSAL